jgi:hypothetical protein
MVHSVAQLPAELDELAGGVRISPWERDVQVVVLCAPDSAPHALKLSRSWTPRVPAAAVRLLRVCDHDGIEEIASTLDSFRTKRLVLVGIGETAATALQLAFSGDGPACAGVLACGDVLPPLALLTEDLVRSRTRLRLVWMSADPLFSAGALGDMLAWFLAAGLDAQGTVLDGRARSGPEPADPDPTLARMAGAYLAELVAFALFGREPA